MARVYVSSTFEDLRECREKVRLILQQLGHTDVAMETYVAGPERPVEKCLADVAASDLYIGIFAWRYGYIPPGHDLAITELEYRAAVEHEKDCLIFLLDEEAPWPPKFVDDDKASIRRLRGQLAADHTCSFFGTADQLAALAGAAVTNWSASRAGALAGSQELPPAVVAGYAQRLQQQYGRLDLDALTPAEREEYLQIQLRAVFVEPSVREDPPPVELPKELWERLQAEGEIFAEDLPDGFDLASLQQAQAAYQARPPRRVLDVLAEEAGQHAVVLGDPGAGKSTLARYLALSLLDADPGGRLSELRGYVPLLVELRTYARVRAEGKAETFVEFLGYLAETEGYPFSAAQLEAVLQSGGRVLVIFDGLDELFDPAGRELAAKRIAGFAARYPAARILVTSRIVGYRRGILSNAGFEHYTLQDLSDEQIGGFLQTWYGLAFHGRGQEAAGRRERLLKAVAESRSIRELAGNPMLLTILAIIGKGQELPRERWKLYDHAATVLVHHWDVNKHLRDGRIDADFIGEDDKKELLRQVAHRMQAGAGGLAGNHLPAGQLQEAFETYLRDRYQRDPASAKVIATAMIGQFHERNFILSRYGASVYGFVHRAFLEFFCADHYVQQFEKLQELSIDQLTQRVYAAHWADPSWREVLRLIAGRIAARFAGEIIRFLARDAYHPWPERFGDQPPRNIVLAVQCLGEVHSSAAVRKDAEELLRVIIKLLEHSVGTQDRARDNLLQQELLPAVRTVGGTWPGRELYRPWYQETGVAYTQAPISEIAAQIAGILLSDSQDAHDTLGRLARNGADYRQRAAAVMGLAEGWGSSPATQALLGDLARADKHRVVRQAALIKSYDLQPATDATRALLSDRASGDPSKDVRRAALLTLEDGWLDDPHVLLVLGRTALNDTDADLREFAQQRLRTDPASRNYLEDHARSNSDARTRGDAMTLLAWLWPGDEEILILLRIAAGEQDPGIRQAVATALGYGWAERPDVFTRLLDLSRDQNPAVAKAAGIVLLYSWPDRPEIFGLLPALASDQNLSVRQTAATTLETAAVTQPEALTALLSLTRDQDWQVQLAAVTALETAATTQPEALTALLSLTRNQNPSVWRAAVTALGTAATTQPEALTALLSLTRNQDWQVRQAAATALETAATAAQPEALTALLSLTHDQYWQVRLAAVTALGTAATAQPETLTALLSLTRNQDWAIGQAAATALETAATAAQPEALTALLSLTRNEDWAIRWVAATALGTAAAAQPEALTALLSLTRDQDWEVRLAAATALRTAAAAQPEALTALLSLTRDQDPDVRRAAVTALGTAATAQPEALTALLSLTRGQDWQVRQAAATALGTAATAQPEALTALLSLTRDQDWAIRQAAVTALSTSELRDHGTLDFLRHQAGNEQDPQLRRDLQKAILRSASARSRSPQDSPRPDGT
jgi:HEAT repeat protein